MLFRDYPFLKDYVPKPVVTFKNKKNVFNQNSITALHYAHVEWSL
jgi:hypothetical protein